MMSPDRIDDTPATDASGDGGGMTDKATVLEEASCPSCGDDLMAHADADGYFTDGDPAWCAGCGLRGQVTCDSETPAYFEEIDHD